MSLRSVRYPVFLLEVDFISSLSLLLGLSSKVPPFECLTSQVSGALLGGGRGCPNPPISWGCLFTLFCRLSGLQSFSLPQYQTRFPSHHTPTHFPSLSPHLWLLSSLSQVGLRRLHLGTSVCWSFWVLWIVSCVVCTLFCLMISSHYWVHTIHILLVWITSHRMIFS